MKGHSFSLSGRHKVLCGHYFSWVFEHIITFSSLSTEYSLETPIIQECCSVDARKNIRSGKLAND